MNEFMEEKSMGTAIHSWRSLWTRVRGIAREVVAIASLAVCAGASANVFSTAVVNQKYDDLSGPTRDVERFFVLVAAIGLAFPTAVLVFYTIRVFRAWSIHAALVVAAASCVVMTLGGACLNL